MIGTVLQDFKYSLRVLLKSPGFALVAVIVLALGIGANTAIFSVVNAVLLRPLPFPDSDRLVRLWHVPPEKSFPGIHLFSISPANYLDWEDQNHVFSQMAIYGYREFNLTGTDHPEKVDVRTVSPNFFSVLQVQPVIGRVFTPEENQPGHNNVVLLGYRFWQGHFGGNREIVGQNIHLNGESFLVAGVMPASMRLPDEPQMWTPLAWTDKERAVRGNHNYLAIARLKPGVDFKQAQAEMNTISARLEQQYPEDDKGWGAVAMPLRDDLVSDVRLALLVLLGAVAFVLLIACANIANLVLAKTLARSKEIAIRTALGASTSRVLSQILSETVLLALAGGALGLVFAHYGVQLIVAFLGDKLPRSTEISLDGEVLGFALLVSLLTGILAGLLPAWRLTKTDLNEALKQGLGRTDSDSGGRRARGVLVVSEVSLSLILLVGAGLMIRSLWMLRAVNPGFDPHHILTLEISVPATKFPKPAQQINFFNDVLQRVRTLPGIESASVVDNLPLSGNGSHQPIAIEGRPPAPMSEQPEVDVHLISTGYLSAMGIPLLRGRDLNDSDVAGRPSAVLINASLARRFWPNENPIGKRLTLSFFPDSVREIVGVVGDSKVDSLDETRDTATLYFPLAQISSSSDGWRSFGMNLVVRTASNPTTVVSAVANAIHQVDRDAPVLNVRTMDDLVDSSLSPQRFNMLMLAAFAGLALLLAAVGIYSVLSYSVKRRVREIGIRMALGAQVRDVLRLILLEGMRPTLIGLAIGLAGALALGRVLSNLIYGVKPTDPITFATVSVLLASVGLCASVIPAYRATRVEPMKTLRDE